MRVLIYTYNYHPEPIGIAPLTTELAEGLHQRGHQVRVVTSMPNYPQRQIYPEYRGKFYCTEEKGGIQIRRSFVWVKPNPKLLDRILLDGSFVLSSLPYALLGWRPDVILATSPPLPSCVSATALKILYNCPLVLNVQDILPDGAIQVGLLTSKTLIRIFKGLEKFAYANATKIAIIGDGFAQNLLAKNVPAEKLVQIPNWVDVDFIRPLPKDENTFRKIHELESKFVVLYAGNIALTQGLGTVLETADRLRENLAIHFVIVGEPKALAKLKETYQPAENVLLLEFQPREKLPEMLAAADVSLVVQKRNISFNLPSKIPVILASGRPLVASVSHAGSAAQAVRNSSGGIVVEPENPQALADAIDRLHRNPEEARSLGEKGRQHAIETYSFASALQSYETLFAALVDRKKN